MSFRCPEVSQQFKTSIYPVKDKLTAWTQPLNAIKSTLYNIYGVRSVNIRGVRVDTPFLDLNGDVLDDAIVVLPLGDMDTAVMARSDFRNATPTVVGDTL